MDKFGWREVTEIYEGMSPPRLAWTILLIIASLLIALSAFTDSLRLTNFYADDISSYYAFISSLYTFGALMGILLTIVLLINIKGRPEITAFVVVMTYLNYSLSLIATLYIIGLDESTMAGTTSPLSEIEFTELRGILALIWMFVVVPLMITWFYRVCSSFPNRLTILDFPKEAKNIFGKFLLRSQKKLVTSRSNALIGWKVMGVAAVIVMTEIFFDRVTNAQISSWSFILVTLILFWYIWFIPVSFCWTNYRITDSSGKSRLLWFVVGFIICAILYIVSAIASSLNFLFEIDIGIYIEDISTALMAPIGFIFFAISIFYNGAIDPALVIKRSTVYGTVGVIFLFLMAGLGNVVSEFFESQLGLSGVLGTWLYGGVIAVAMIPLKSRFEKLANRYMPQPTKDLPVNVKNSSIDREV